MSPSRFFGRRWSALKRADDGIATIELGLLLPVFVFLVLGVSVFGRVLFAAVTLSHAARAGAAYGGQMSATVGDVAGIRTAAQAEATDITPITVSSRFYCTCETGTATNCVTGTCGAYGPPLLFVEVTANKAVSLSTPFPGIPNSVSLSRTATLRVQ